MDSKLIDSYLVVRKVIADFGPALLDQFDEMYAGMLLMQELIDYTYSKMKYASIIFAHPY